MTERKKAVKLEETPEYQEMQRRIDAAFKSAIVVFGCARCAQAHLDLMNDIQANGMEFDKDGNALPRMDGALYKCPVCIAEAAKPDPAEFDDLIPF